MITKALLQAILAQYRLPLYGLHGIDHWARVLENGKRLSQETNAKLAVVQLFAIFHDACRQSEGHDDDHGRRGAEFAADLRGTLLNLDSKDFDLLYHACADHTRGYTQADVTVQTCWDSDRLDLGRAGIRPHKHYLCTPAAKNKEIIAWADERSRNKLLPAWLSTEWGLGSTSGSD
jgi:uncharacterized protein